MVAISHYSQKYGEYRKIKEGKVRIIYKKPWANNIIVVTTDRVSAFDSKLGIEIPDKGKILTGISADRASFAESRGIMTAYLSSNAVGPSHANPFGAFDAEEFSGPEFAGRVTKMAKLKMFPVECIVRAHICGSAWEAYQRGEREICGIRLPDGLKEGQKLPEPIFTPTTKAPEGQHDENITLEQMAKILEDAGRGCYDTAVKIKNLCLRLFGELYKDAADHLLILADTKFELGLDEYQNITFGDEIGTPDSSRYWDATQFVPGYRPISFDQQSLRDWYAAAKSRGETNPQIPAEVISDTLRAYINLYERITGEEWPK